MKSHVSRILTAAIVSAAAGCGTVEPGEASPDAGGAGAADAAPSEDTAPSVECEVAGDCDDGLFCNGVESCAEGRCVAGEPPECDDGVACTQDLCDESKAACLSVADHALCTGEDGGFCHPSLGCGEETCSGDEDCDDGVFCNGAERCDIAEEETVGRCEAGPPPSCDDGIACTSDACDAAADACAYVPEDMACSDGAFCTGEELCEPSLGCVGGTPPALGDGVSCTVDACDESDGVTHTPDDSLCDDGKFCNGVETCGGSGCAAGSPPKLSDGVSCTIDSCSESLDKVLHQPSHAACDDGKYCNGEETCDASSGCQSPGSNSYFWSTGSKNGTVSLSCGEQKKVAEVTISIIGPKEYFCQSSSSDGLRARLSAGGSVLNGPFVGSGCSVLKNSDGEELMRCCFQ